MASWNRSNLLQTKLMADVEFEVKAKTTGIPQKIAAHRAILASSSPVFERMFNGGFQDIGVIEIVDADAESFTEFLQLIYDDNVKLTDGNVSNVLALIDKYDVKPGLEIVQNFLLKSVKAENSITYLELALQYKLSKPLIDKCEEIHCENSADVLQSPGFLNAKEEAVIKLLNSDKLRCDEKAVLSAAIGWAKKSLSIKNLVASQENICAELIEVMEEYPELFNVSICGDILKYIICKRPLRTLDYKTEKRLAVQLDPIEISFNYSYVHIYGYDSGVANQSEIEFSVANRKDHTTCNLSLIGFDFVIIGFITSNSGSRNFSLDATIKGSRGRVVRTKCVIDSATVRKFACGTNYSLLKGTLTTPLLINQSSNRGNTLVVTYSGNLDTNMCMRTIKNSSIIISTGNIINKDVSFRISNKLNNFVTKLYFKRN
jgi:hypothetical protein